MSNFAIKIESGGISSKAVQKFNDKTCHAVEENSLKILIVEEYSYTSYINNYDYSFPLNTTVLMYESL
jgi:hypothetical protein